MSMVTNQNHDASSTRNRFKTCDNGGAGPWSDLIHHVLYFVLMQLGIVDYLSFGGVCKSWRSFALSERNTFLASKSPMTMRIHWPTHAKTCCLKDFEGREYFNATLASFGGGVCVGLTCGYLIFFRRTTRNFWLVNPFTRHQLYFKDFPNKYKNDTHKIRAILVFSHSVCGWVFVVMNRYSRKIWFSIAGTGTWNHVSCRYLLADLRAFKGIMYTLNFNHQSHLCQLYELRLNTEPKLTLLETKNSLKTFQIPELVCSGKNIYVMDRTPEDHYRFQELDFGEMKWVLREKTMAEYTSFISTLKHGVADKSVFGESRGKSLLLGHDTGDMLELIEVEKTNCFDACMWYFTHECLNVDHVE